jgi:predicted type IV restriction endonuclease
MFVSKGNVAMDEVANRSDARRRLIVETISLAEWTKVLICVDNFQRGKDAQTQVVELKKINSWEQAAFITKGGWATIPGMATVDTAVARACAEMIVAIKC